MSDRAFAPVAGGYLPQLADGAAGAKAQDVNGCSAVWGGAANGWAITLEEPVLDEDLIVNYNGAPGSGVDGLTLNMTSAGPGAFVIRAQRNVAGVSTAVAVPISFIAYHRPQRS